MSDDDDRETRGELSDDETRALITRRGVETVSEVLGMLRRAGWDFVAVAVGAAFERSDGKIEMPGSTAYDASRDIMPAFPAQADHLRRLAVDIDDEYRKSGETIRADGSSQILIERK